MDHTYDLIIIGAGPAGITAGVYAARKKMDFLILTGDIGGQISWTNDIENYTGYLFITGTEMITRFQEHIDKYGIQIRENELVRDLYKDGPLISVKTDKALFSAKTVIIASGKKPRRLNVPGEEKYRNKGVAYCATCEGPLFSGKDVVVVGGGNSAMEAVIQLMKIAGKVYVINNTARLNGDRISIDRILGAGNVEVHNNSRVIEIAGEKFVTKVRYAENGTEKSLETRGVFVEIGLDPNSGFVRGVDKNDRDEILVNSATETNIPGVFAAGDVSAVIDKQIIVAAGEGAKAALSAFRYLIGRGE